LDNYQWYKVVEGDEIQQGDILENCPVFVLPPDVELDSPTISDKLYEMPFQASDVIVMSQTCDMVKGRQRISEVLLCSIWSKSDFNKGDMMSGNKDWENARKGRFPGFHVLNKCDLEGFKRDYKVVDFRRVYSLPIDLTRRIAVNLGQRICLLPPYREHLSQAFARFFMRVGLPVDIPPFI
jgi:hypothetical protein